MSKAQAHPSAFKQLYTEMFTQGGDFSKVGANLKKPIKCLVKEAYPYFLVTDDYFFVPAYFTKEALAEFHSKHANVHVVDLAEKVIVLNNWTLEMKKVNSAEVFTSYANLEVRLIVHSFKPNLQEKLNASRYPLNLYRDDEMKTTIQHFRHQALSVIIPILILLYRNLLPRMQRLIPCQILLKFLLLMLERKQKLKIQDINSIKISTSSI